jgi:hypothetical protein
MTRLPKIKPVFVRLLKCKEQHILNFPILIEFNIEPLTIMEGLSIVGKYPLPRITRNTRLNRRHLKCTIVPLMCIGHLIKCGAMKRQEFAPPTCLLQGRRE